MAATLLFPHGVKEFVSAMAVEGLSPPWRQLFVIARLFSFCSEVHTGAVKPSSKVTKGNNYARTN
jgi:hypothetical protein